MLAQEWDMPPATRQSFSKPTEYIGDIILPLPLTFPIWGGGGRFVVVGHTSWYADVAVVNIPLNVFRFTPV